jgi:hypothetical protein
MGLLSKEKATLLPAGFLDFFEICVKEKCMRASRPGPHDMVSVRNCNINVATGIPSLEML